MKKFSPNAFVRGRFPLAIFAGLVLAMAFPKIGIAGLAWIAPALILSTSLGKRGGETFRIGYVAGLAHYLGSLAWLLNIPYTWHRIPIGPAAGWLALAAFLALFPATWVWLTIKSSPATQRLSPNWVTTAREIAKLSWAQRMSWAVRAAVTWTALEMIVARIFGGFPWNLLGDSQYRIVPLIQFASFTGIYGVSFLIVWTSMSLLCGAVAVFGKPTQRSPWMAEIILPFAAIFVAMFYGFHQLAHPDITHREVKVALAQPGIPQTMIWDPEQNRERFRDLMVLSDDALAQPADALIWPEAALPGTPFDEDGKLGAPLADLARHYKAWLLIGGDDVEAKPAETNYFNACFLINPDGKLAERYHKRGLVILGEYVPLKRWLLPLATWMGGVYTPGDQPVQFQLSTASAIPPEKVQTSVLICFEDVFPHLARQSVQPDTDFLVNITNDGWFGEGAAQWQQAAAATFRTIENGVPLIRCANTGITCWIDRFGRWRQVFTDKNGSVYGVGSMHSTIPLPDRHSQTFYNQHGDWFGWACVAFAGIILIGQIRSRIADKTAAAAPATNGAD